jgi:hypothetical protein
MKRKDCLKIATLQSATWQRQRFGISACSSGKQWARFFLPAAYPVGRLLFTSTHRTLSEKVSRDHVNYHTRQCSAYGW